MTPFFEEARSLWDRFPEKHVDPIWVRTLGAFVDHPVAALNRARTHALCKIIGDEPKNILDLGCGGGLMSLALSRVGHRVVGLDYGAEDVSMAKHMAREFDLPSLFYVFNVTSQEREWQPLVERNLGGRPDVVLLNYYLHHELRLDRLLGELHSWLPTQSKVLVNEENPLSPTFLLKHMVRTVIQRDTEEENHRTVRGWSSLFQKHGFELSRTSALDPLPLLDKIIPQLCWSQILTATKRH